MGEIKIGTLKGQDEHGNMYYENLQYQLGRFFICFYLDLGRHRWVEYAGWHWRFDYTQISPAWLGWLASSYDETPDEVGDMGIRLFVASCPSEDKMQGD